MESLRSSLRAAERSVTTSASPVHGYAHRGGHACVFKVGVAIALVGLVVTNLMTWRALDRERSRRDVAERSLLRSDRSATLVLGSTAQPRPTDAVNGTVARIPAVAITTTFVATAPPKRAASQQPDIARLAKKLADPAARDALRESMKGTTLQLYGDLLKRWHLSGASADSALEALADHQANQLANALAPGNESGDQTNAADNDAVRAVLSARQLDQLRAYDSTLQDRQTIAPFLNELELAQTPLSKDAAEQFVTIMHDERVAVPQPTAPPGAQAPSAQAMEVWQTDLDQRIRDKAGFILSSAALSKLESFQSAQRAAASVFSSVMTAASDANMPTGGSGTN
jgi:hypothetical protein